MSKLLKTVLLLGICTMASAAERIVSTAGYASEIVYKLGKADSLAGVDTTSKIPASVMDSKPKIGYRRQLSAEGILSLHPDLILFEPDAGPDSVLAQIQNSGIAALKLTDEQTLADIRQDITAIGKAIGAEQEAAVLNAQIVQDEAALAASLKTSGMAACWP